jgi:DNA polymerase-1
MEDESIEKVAQNIKFDIHILANYGVNVKGPLFDTMLAHYIFEPEMRHNMDLLSRKYLHYDPIPIEELIGKAGKKQLSMADLPPGSITNYACEDADVVFRLKPKLEPLLKENGGEKVFYEVEIPLVSVLADMERAGVRIDEQALKAYSIQLRDEMIEAEKQVYELAGMSFNINSPAQLGEVLFDHLKLDEKAKRTAKSKQYSTNEEVLSQLALKHDIAARILDYRSLQKLKSTYVDALPLLINPRTGRVHTSYNQAVAATGRLSSTDPNLQNIPIRTDRGREIRKAFIPRDENHIILSADYSQIELRLIAEISGEENMSKAFADKLDIHTDTSARIFGVGLEEVTSDMRRKAKMVNFGIIYGISAFGLAQRLRIPRSEAAMLIEQYNIQYPGIKKYLNSQVEFAREHGYVETLLGRRRYLRDINSGNATTRGFAERNAINAPIQGSAADMIKIAMINIYAEMNKRQLKSKMILQVHDELIFDVLREEKDELMALVKEGMKNALPVKVPIDVEMGTGDNWLEAH